MLWIRFVGTNFTAKDSDFGFWMCLQRICDVCSVCVFVFRVYTRPFPGYHAIGLPRPGLPRPNLYLYTTVTTPSGYHASTVYIPRLPRLHGLPSPHFPVITGYHTCSSFVFTIPTSTEVPPRLHLHHHPRWEHKSLITLAVDRGVADVPTSSRRQTGQAGNRVGNHLRGDKV